MPLVHLEPDLDEDIAGDDASDAAVQEKRRRAQLSPRVRELEDAVAEAVADGDGPVLVRRAQRQLDEALEAEALKDKSLRKQRAAVAAKLAAARKLKADAVEEALRAHGPYCEFHAGGREVRIELGNPEQAVRGFAVEAIKRVAQQAANGFQNKVVASRQRGAAAVTLGWTPESVGWTPPTPEPKRLPSRPDMVTTGDLP